MKKILLTGSKGFIGSALRSELEASGYDVSTLDLPKADVANARAFDTLTKKSFQRVFHLAGKTFIPESWADPGAFYRANVDGTLNVLECCRKTRAPLTFVSAYVYGRAGNRPIKETAPPQPNNPYTHSKVLAENLCRFYASHFGVSVTVLRLFNVYGPGQNERFLIPMAIKQALTSDRIRVKTLSPRRDYVHIQDVTRALRLTMKHRKGFHLYNIGSGRSRSVKEVLRTICHATEPKRLLSDNKHRHDDIPNTIADIRLAARELGWKPQITFEGGILKMVQQSHV